VRRILIPQVEKKLKEMELKNRIEWQRGIIVMLNQTNSTYSLKMKYPKYA